jgi:hypothetical protein
LLQILNNCLADKITKHHHTLILQGPVTEPMFCPVVKSKGQTKIYGWEQLCKENGFSDGDVVKFMFFDFENSNRVDVDKVSD